ncbi:MAG: SGNH/GDSL hydrolase family protein [Opitutaceae bacterium]|nr:SGNH/GDSL hydrolase family protein [Opitutaceae bacterium]
MTSSTLLYVAALFSPFAASAIPANELAAEARAERPQLRHDFAEALAPVTDMPGLPRVLLIGDSISLGYTPFVRDSLRGVANVHRIPDNGGPTIRGLALLDEWLGTTRWDVIHFNWGLHDLKRVEGGYVQVPIADYERNLCTLVARLKASGAKLVFAMTTPVPIRTSNRVETDVVAYNAIALKVMTAAKVPVDDLHAFAFPRLAQIQLRANVHFTSEGYRELSKAVVATIRTQLPHP